MHLPLRRRRSLSLAGSALAVLACAVLAAGASAGRSPALRAGPSGVVANAPTTLTWAVSSPINSLDMVKGWSLPLLQIAGLSFEGLLRTTPDGKLAPALASSWKEVNPTTYVYKLRRGVKFSDGTPLTPGDVIYSWKTQANPKSGSLASNFFASMKSVTQTGPDELTVKLRAPDALWRYQPAHLSAFVFEKAYALQHPNDLGQPGVLNIGTGPYKFTSFTAGSSVTLERNANYWGPVLGPDKITINVVQDPSAQILAIRSGQIDGSFAVTPDQASQWKSAGANVAWVLSQGFGGFIFNNQVGPFSDVHVRRAISYATNKRAIVTALLHGFGAPASTLMPSASWASLGAPDVAAKAFATTPAYTFNMRKARAELAASHYPSGFSATLTYPDAQPLLGKAGQVLSANLVTLGIHLRLHEVPFATWLSRVLGGDKKKLGLEAVQFYPDYPDPANALALFANSANATPGGFDLAGYKNHAVDQLIKTQAVTTSQAVRARLIAQIQRTVASDAAYLPLWWNDIGVATRSDLRFRRWNAFYLYQPWAWYIHQ